ncbi:DUF742 domain-containing protein [Nocardioides daphniae]|uniref:DUF742 domain-containing protein n=1 Tax=Nocardioides daphniae TaxID=402297 RepID=A0A4P7UD52_9ACTN|nr:DUF742 domain-containing protein [Nocardioides daphniae]QCC77238.1 DUF742 domain-containing protein [Nocardioides daphniae]GGD26342.1 hypothetical protein GCM10007231_27210 [Nocardioides daphniae]
MPTPDVPFGKHADEPARPAFVRPFTLTRGRTVPRVDLPFEATLVTTPQSHARVLGEHARALALCDGRSVAEVAAAMKLPIGVVRVLVGDLVADGHVAVRRTLTERSSFDERRDLLQRTLAGLKVS